MEIGRIVSTKLWEDEKVENFTPEEKYFWLFLLTNPKTSQLGIYQITYKTMSFYTGYEIETCRKLIARLEEEYRMIRYIDGEIAIKNFLRYGVRKGGKPVEDLLKKEIKQVQHRDLLNWMFGNVDIEHCNETVKAIAKDMENEIVEVNAKPVQTSKLDEALEDFETMRKKIKKPLTPRAKAILINKLEKLASNEEEKVEILNQSILHCWQDIYPLRTETQYEYQTKENRTKKQVDELPIYDVSKNKKMSEEETNEILRLMGKQTNT
ncbi:MAG: hypothetical protein KBT03_04050 [Bacteroidales bacterium]|nr:hypothetical protein [Candidatus Scybalousia scybalohippi]